MGAGRTATRVELGHDLILLEQVIALGRREGRGVRRANRQGCDGFRLGLY